jgi:hypothetical protein
MLSREYSLSFAVTVNEKLDRRVRLEAADVEP